MLISCLIQKNKKWMITLLRKPQPRPTILTVKQDNFAFILEYRALAKNIANQFLETVYESAEEGFSKREIKYEEES
jgi:hypothetical protein